MRWLYSVWCYIMNYSHIMNFRNFNIIRPTIPCPVPFYVLSSPYFNYSPPVSIAYYSLWFTKCNYLFIFNFNCFKLSSSLFFSLFLFVVIHFYYFFSLLAYFSFHFLSVCCNFMTLEYLVLSFSVLFYFFVCPAVSLALFPFFFHLLISIRWSPFYINHVLD